MPGHEQDLRLGNDPAIENQRIAGLKVGAATFRETPSAWDAQGNRFLAYLGEEGRRARSAPAVGQVRPDQRSRARGIKAERGQCPPNGLPGEEGDPGDEAGQKRPAMCSRCKSGQVWLARGRDDSSLRGGRRGGKGLPRPVPLATRTGHRVASRMPETEGTASADQRRIGGMVFAGLGAAMIAWSTLRPHPASHLFLAGSCCSISDVVLNILLFIPLGAGLVMLGLRPGMAVVTGALVSIVIEVAQYWWIAGRFASVADVAANVAGTILGVAMAVRWDLRARWWPKVAPVIALTVLLLWLLGGQVAQPAIPGPAPWGVERAAAVLDVGLQGFALPDGPVADLPALRARLAASDTVRFLATVVTGAAVPGRLPLVEIVVGEGTSPFLVLSEDGGTLLAYQRLGLDWVGLRGPWLALDEVLSPPAGDSVHILLEATRRDLRLAATRGGVQRQSSLTLSPDLYFSALFYRITDAAVWWNLVPAMASFVLLGLALANRPKLLVVASLVALFMSARTGGCAYPAWPVVLVTMLGAWAGWRAGRMLGLFSSG